jgi:signal transduction histidine kinase
VDAVRQGIGLISMSERAEQVGATLQIRSRPGSGTQVVLNVPFQSETLKVSSVL